MPITATYPGVYIEEVPSGVRPIIGVATSIAAFIGWFPRGAFEEAVRIFNPQDFDREFGGLAADSLASYAIEQFFLNGGTQAWVVRTAGDGTTATAAVVLRDTADADALEVRAVNAGAWGDNIRIDINYGTATPTETFNMIVNEVVNGAVVNSESFLNLSTNSADPRYGVDVVNDQSKLVRLTELAVARPAKTGTASDLITDLSVLDLTGNISIQIGGDNGGPVTLASTPTTMATLASALQTALRSAGAAFADVTVGAVGSIGTGAFLQVKAGTDAADDSVDLTGPLADALGLSTAANLNVQQYALGGGPVPGTHQNGANGGAAQPGDNGTQPGATELVDALAAFDPVDLFNILCIPRTDQMPDGQAFTVIAEGIGYCARRRAFMIVDVPQADATRDEITEIEAWLDVNATLRHENAALYFPRPRVPDPLNEFRLRSIPASGTLAGLYARTDGDRGVWKAPAGLEAQVRGVQELELKMTDAENGIINPLGINALRTFRNTGNVCWGARTLAGADQLASEWKYVPIRRLALFLEESLYRGTQFAVFEPNDEPLWAQIRLNIGAFMQNLFRQGAFQGSTPRLAYLVKCDSETTTQDDINRGIVNIIVGFAPLKPAEFVIIKITQLAGQSQGG